MSYELCFVLVKVHALLFKVTECR